MARDNFTRKTINMLAERVGFLCSNPACGCHTVGPNHQPDKSTRIGKAAHITAAAAGGPRYDSALATTARSAIANGIWLCSNCADLIDKDEIVYSTSLLNVWKSAAEQKMSKSIKAIHALIKDESTGPYLEADLVFLRSMRMPGEISSKNPGYVENGIYIIDAGPKPIIHWSLGWELSLRIHNNSSYPAFNVSVEIEAGDIQTIERSTLPAVNNLPPFEMTKLNIKHMEKLESTHLEADERLKQRIPEAFKDVTFKIYYFDEHRNRHRTIMKVTDQHTSNEKA